MFSFRLVFSSALRPSPKNLVCALKNQINLWHNHDENLIETDKIREVIVAAFFGISAKSDKIRANFIKILSAKIATKFENIANFLAFLILKTPKN